MADNEKLRAYHLKIHKIGRLKYSLLYGSLFGVIMFFAVNLIELFDNSIMETYFSKAALQSFLLGLAMSYLIHATFLWWVNEQSLKKLNKLLETEEIN